MADDLRAGMAPATRSELRTSLLKFLGPYTRNVSTDSLDDEVGMFVAALSGLPLWAVRQALLNWLQAKIPDCSPKFVPKPPELRQEADRIAQTRRHALGSIDAVLSAEVQQMPSDADREAAIAHWNDAVRPLLQQAEEVSRHNGRAEQEHANEVVLNREIGPDSMPRMTKDLRAKIAAMPASMQSEDVA